MFRESFGNAKMLWRSNRGRKSAAMASLNNSIERFTISYILPVISCACTTCEILRKQLAIKPKVNLIGYSPSRC